MQTRVSGENVLTPEAAKAETVDVRKRKGAEGPAADIGSVDFQTIDGPKHIPNGFAVDEPKGLPVHVPGARRIWCHHF